MKKPKALGILAMLTILRESGFEVVIFPNDRGPAHVHVRKAGEMVRISLLTLAFGAKRLASGRHTKRAEKLVGQHADRLRREWRRLQWNRLS